MSPSNIPVPVPKDSLFKVKATVDPVKAKVKAAKVKAYSTHNVAAAPTPAADQPSLKDLVKAKGQGVDLLPPKPQATTFDPPQVKAVAQPVGLSVVIPSELWHAIMSKPSTGGGWQQLMGELKKVSMTMNPDMHWLTLSPALLAKIIDKATIGSGGYQSVLRWIVCLVAKQQPGAISNAVGKGGAT